MSRFAFAVCGLMLLAVLAGATWGWANDPLFKGSDQDRVSAREGSPDKDYWAVCCRNIDRSRGRMGGTSHCIRCTMGQIDTDYTSRLPSHCKWFKDREQAEEHFHQRHTCP